MNTWVRLLRAHASTTRAMNADLLNEHGLTINDFEALLHLSRADGRRMRRVDLAEGLLLTASGVTRLLDGLEAAGYVERAACDSDRRVVYAVITDKGREKLEAASQSHVVGVSSLLQERFDDDELTQLADLLARLDGDDSPVDEDCGT
jgi:DNA-binding MarR family transcriptional regulator